MTLNALRETAVHKDNFVTLQDFTDFAQRYLEYIATSLQAVIVARNENIYRFFQYDKSGNYAVTRPINSKLMLTHNDFNIISQDFFSCLDDIVSIKNDIVQRENINRFVYTCQQAIGATLDSLPTGMSNTARKINGDLFEHFVRLILSALNISVRSGIVSVPIIRNGEMLAEMKYQHDLIIGEQDNVVSIGSVKTSSKDRIDKIFVDKLTYNMLTQSSTPHFAIFLNDVQRKGTQRNYGINTTFLAGHFKAYSICLNPLDGVFYCDLRPVMREDPFLRQHIKSFDSFIVEAVWNLV